MSKSIEIKNSSRCAGSKGLIRVEKGSKGSKGLKGAQKGSRRLEKGLKGSKGFKGLEKAREGRSYLAYQ
jgi:hypothetical protein